MSIETHTEGLHSTDAARATCAEAAGHKFYVTVRESPSAGRTGFLLGPYETHADALANVERAKRAAYEANSRAPFYCYGTSSTDAVRETVFGR